MTAIQRASVRPAISGSIPLANKSRVEIVERPRTTAGAGGGTPKDLFHLGIVIVIQAA